VAGFIPHRWAAPREAQSHQRAARDEKETKGVRLL
jgi:hypothetical protein